ncbi:hypothetical protein NMG60_11021360 [Bertholletia excelsa]
MFMCNYMLKPRSTVNKFSLIFPFLFRSVLVFISFWPFFSVAGSPCSEKNYFSGLLFYVLNCICFVQANTDSFGSSSLLLMIF